MTDRATGTAAVAAERGSSNGRAIFEAEGIVKRFGGIRAVNGATMSVQEGSITALIGPNGAGKTTFFNLITGFYKPDAGTAVFDGAEVQGKPPYAIARRGMVRTFQITKALARMPVIDNMMLAAPDQPGERLGNAVFKQVSAHAEWHGWRRPDRFLRSIRLREPAWRRRESEVREQALELLEVFNLSKLADNYAGTLSGGQRKLLELARALMARPRFLLLDEPMAGINPTLGKRLLDHMQRLRHEEGVTFLFVEHDMEVVMNHADRVVVMAEGRVIAEGEPHEVRSDQSVIDAYLGGARMSDEQIEADERAPGPPQTEERR